jgi:hypothetical protein
VVKRPRQIPARAPLTNAQICAATYVGSKEHKIKRWWGGMPGARLGKDGKAHRPNKERTTICPLVTAAERDIATGWVRAALANGWFEYHDADQEYPARIWYLDADTGTRWEGFRVTDVLGQYKGWPDEEVE